MSPAKPAPEAAAPVVKTDRYGTPLKVEWHGIVSELDADPGDKDKQLFIARIMSLDAPAPDHVEIMITQPFRAPFTLGQRLFVRCVQFTMDPPTSP